MLKKIFAIALALWGIISLSMVFYFTYHFYSEVNNPSRGEFWEGVGLGWILGLPTWLGLPALCFASKKEFRKLFSYLINVPTMVAFAYLLWFWIPIIFKLPFER